MVLNFPKEIISLGFSFTICDERDYFNRYMTEFSILNAVKLDVAMLII